MGPGRVHFVVLLVSLLQIVTRGTCAGRPNLLEATGIVNFQALQTEFSHDHRNLDKLTESIVARESLSFDDFRPGMVVIADFVSPPTGRVVMDFNSDDNDIVLHIDARFDFSGYHNVLNVNHFVSGKWGEEVKLQGFPFTPRHVGVIRVIAEDKGFQITADTQDMYFYPYPTVEGITGVVFYTQDNEPGASVHPCLQSGIIYSRET